MESPEHNDLERFIDEQLRRLPQREAPAGLVRNVMKTIAARENMPWWKQPFTAWSRRKQMLLFVALAAAFGGALYLAWSPAEQLTAGSLIDKARPFAWISGVLETFFGSLWMALRSMPWTWLAAIGAVFMLMYSACLAAGVALYRVASHRSPSFS